MYKNKIKLLEKYISSEEVKDVKQIKIKKKKCNVMSQSEILIT